MYIDPSRLITEPCRTCSHTHLRMPRRISLCRSLSFRSLSTMYLSIHLSIYNISISRSVDLVHAACGHVAHGWHLRPLIETRTQTGPCKPQQHCKHGKPAVEFFEAFLLLEVQQRTEAVAHETLYRQCLCVCIQLCSFCFSLPLFLCQIFYHP